MIVPYIMLVLVLILVLMGMSVLMGGMMFWDILSAYRQSTPTPFPRGAPKGGWAAV